MEKEYCPACGCEIIEGFYELDHIKYCCEACATGGKCECGDCKIVVEEPEDK